MGSSNKTYLRILSFAGVLILSGALMLGLFQSAGALSIDITEPEDTDEGDTATFQVSVTIPGEERLPIDKVRTVVEKTAEGGTNVYDKKNPWVVGDATCEQTPGPGLDSCPEGSGALTQNVNDSILSIEFTGGSPSHLVGYGYDDCGTLHSNGYCFVKHTGYTFTSNRGYGYDRPEFRDQGYRLTDANAGYGYSDGDLTLDWEVTVDTGELDGSGDYWMTFIVETGSGILGEIESESTYFTVSSSGGGSPTGGGNPAGGGDAGLQADLGASFDIEADETILITDLPSGYDNLRLTFAQACDGCTVEMEVHGSSAPSGTSALATSWQVIDYFSLWVEDSDGNEVEGYIDEGSLEFDVNADELDDEDPSQVGLTHNIDNEWEAEDTEHTNDDDDDPLEYNGTISGFSVFAQAVDTEGPEFSNMEPTGDIRQISPTISADWEDNRGIDTDSFELTIDGQTADDTTGTLSVTDDGFSYTPGTAFDETQHDVEATVSDTSGLETTETWTFTVEEGAATCPELPQVTDPQPPDGATDVTFEDTISISVLEGSCPLSTTELAVNGETVATTLEDGMLTADIPDTVEAGEQVNVTASVSDDEGNDQAREWSFTMSEDAEPPSDDGYIIWIIVGLVVAAILGVGAYFYTQQGGA